MQCMRVFTLMCILLLSSNTTYVTGDDEEDEDPVKKATLCEVCKFLATELSDRLHETGKSKEVLETGHGLDKKKKRVKYQTSELRLIEALQEPHICEKILKYKVHKEKKGSLRFNKKESETMETLHGLVNKGVKVDLGIPMEMWDTPSAEVTDMQRKCFKMVEDHEEDIEDWYFHNQHRDIMDYLCADLVLGRANKECLYESDAPQLEDSSDSENQDKKPRSKINKGKSKGEKGDKFQENGRDEL
ncbi:protein canopy 4-like [Mizuhopecten yessoensis]|uniref:Protein canopy-like 4 n=1 Tax=Mizuhopecten yessoensis TaxID=6573 RepID=A0A210PN15_MIZYE|nr:protein canopy 4-like [Mizuhopecten yessoensis]OWF37882.1 Protein canopy-like 4 [Mizuhopecten yessoensis]